MINYVSIKDLANQWSFSTRTVVRRLDELSGYMAKGYFPKDAVVRGGRVRVDEEAFRHYMTFKSFYDNHCHAPKFVRGRV